ncbi:MAG: ABC transporter substrate-binding protein, partial [Blautia sp.]|nr:ABC transporter substrate-binding protein [Blautia sp.]
MQRKRLFYTTAAALLSAFTLSVAVYAEGSAEAEKETAPVTVTALKGPTAMGMVKLMDDSDQGISEGTYEFSILSAVDEVTPLIAQGKTDIAAVPANLASVLYNNTDGAIEVLAINTLGVLYIMEDGDSIASVEDLRGKTIYASGKGATPEYALNYILRENGIDPASDVTIEWKSEHAECLAALTEAEGGIAMLPQPFVTTAQTKMDHLRVALDLTQEWEKTQEGEEAPSQLITGVVVAKTSFIEEYPEKV